MSLSVTGNQARSGGNRSWERGRQDAAGIARIVLIKTLWLDLILLR